MCLLSLAGAAGPTRTPADSKPPAACCRAVVAGVRQAEVARRLGMSARAASVGHGRFKAGGPAALHSRGPCGLVARLSDAQLARVRHLLGLVCCQITWRRLDSSWSLGSSSVGRT